MVISVHESVCLILADEDVNILVTVGRAKYVDIDRRHMTRFRRDNANSL